MITLIALTAALLSLVVLVAWVRADHFADRVPHVEDLGRPAESALR